jgi:hypothetical protein
LKQGFFGHGNLGTRTGSSLGNQCVEKASPASTIFRFLPLGSAAIHFATEPVAPRANHRLGGLHVLQEVPARLMSCRVAF